MEHQEQLQKLVGQQVEVRLVNNGLIIRIVETLEYHINGAYVLYNQTHGVTFYNYHVYKIAGTDIQGYTIYIKADA